jgi:hypothetical protein
LYGRRELDEPKKQQFLVYYYLKAELLKPKPSVAWAYLTPLFLIEALVVVLKQSQAARDTEQPPRLTNMQTVLQV